MRVGLPCAAVAQLGWGGGGRGAAEGEDSKIHDFMAASMLILCIYGRVSGIANGGREGVEEGGGWWMLMVLLSVFLCEGVAVACWFV